MKIAFLSVSSLLFLATFFSCNKEQPRNWDEYVKGCGNFFVHRIVSDDMILSVWIDNKKIAFSTDFQTFENIGNEDFSTVEIRQNCEIEKEWHGICNDIGGGSSCQNVYWKLEKGKLSFKVNQVQSAYNGDNIYYATVIIENAEFKKEGSNESRTFEKVEFNDVLVGWLPG